MEGAPVDYRPGTEQKQFQDSKETKGDHPTHVKTFMVYLDAMSPCVPIKKGVKTSLKKSKHNPKHIPQGGGERNHQHHTPPREGDAGC